MARNVILSVLLCLASADLLCAFYLPGVAPKDFKPHDLVEVKVNKIFLLTLETFVLSLACHGNYNLPLGLIFCIT